MTFNSFFFFLFLPALYLAFYFTSDRWRWLVLLIASYGFYASFHAPYLLAVLLLVTVISYLCGLRIAAHRDEAGRKRWLWFGSSACIAILALLKYFPFLESGINSVFGLNSTISTFIISLGVSYFTFQAVSYLADIYLEIEDPEQHFGRFALYLAFFPKLLQGPIERAGDLLPQLRQPYQFDYDAMRSGMLLFAWGLFRKVVVADRLALYADRVYNNVHDYSGLSLLVGTYAYALQIYFDFSAYTDMARGVGRMFGINLTRELQQPLSGHVGGRFLAPLAYIVFPVDNGLYLQAVAAGLEGSGEGRNRPGTDRHVPGVGHLARRNLGLCRLGFAARNIPGGFYVLPSLSEAAVCLVGYRQDQLAEAVAGVCDLQSGELRLDILQGRDTI